jgi:hypothetical protein
VPRSPDLDRERRRRTPRSHLVDHTQFGINPDAEWRPASELEPDELAALIHAYWQHLAACSIRERFGRRSMQDVARQLYGRLVTFGLTDTAVRGHEHIARLLNGTAAAPTHQLFNWAIALEDISILPQPDSIEHLFPPGSIGD